MRIALLGAALLVGLGLAAPVTGAQRARKPVRVILDTDIGPDGDDAGAVAVLHALADRHEARLLAMGRCTSSDWGAPCLDALNTCYGRPDIPVGTFKGAGFLADPREHEKYNREVAARSPHALETGRNAPDDDEAPPPGAEHQRDAQGPANSRYCAWWRTS